MGEVFTRQVQCTILYSYPEKETNLKTACMRCPSCASASSHCDYSLGLCICAPGWFDDAYEYPYLHYCLTSLDSPTMACDGFLGIMSCACRQQCNAAFGDATAKKACFEVVEGEGNRSVVVRPTISDAPLESATVSLRFWMPERMKTPDGFSKRPTTIFSPVAAAATNAVPPPFKKARRIHAVTITLLPNSRCPGGCNGSGTCMVRKCGALRGRKSSLAWRASRLRDAGCAERFPRCVCHGGTAGASCELSSACLHSCSGHGRCVSRMCVCKDGWFGFDCSISGYAHPTEPNASLGAASTLLPTPTETYPRYPPAKRHHARWRRRPRDMSVGGGRLGQAEAVKAHAPAVIRPAQQRRADRHSPLYIYPLIGDAAASHALYQGNGAVSGGFHS